jgi:hypothetical protein
VAPAIDAVALKHCTIMVIVFLNSNYRHSYQGDRLQSEQLGIDLLILGLYDDTFPTTLVRWHQMEE